MIRLSFTGKPNETLQLIRMKKARCLYGKLTRREQQYLQLATKDITDKEIADMMNLSVHTVDAHRNNIRKKLKTRSKLGSVIEALRSGDITL